MLLTLTIILTVLGAIGFGVAWSQTDYITGRAPQWAEAVGMAGVAALAHAVLGGVIGWMGSYAGYESAGYLLGFLGGVLAIGYGVYLSLFAEDDGDVEAWLTAGAALVAIGAVAVLLV